MSKAFCATFAVLVAACSQGGAGGQANAPQNASAASPNAALAAPPASRAIAPGGLIGAELASARQSSDLFTFFHLTPTGPANARGVTDFRPSGPDFAQLADVAVTVDARGRITAMSLTLARSFIDSPTNGVFARDLAKSFLQAAPPPADAQQVSPLTNDIIGTQGTSAAPYTPSTEAYAVFAGQNQPPVAADLANTHFTMGPSVSGGAPALTLTFTAR